MALITVPSAARAQVENSLEAEDNEDAVLFHPPYTPRITASAAVTPPTISVTTYHYNNFRNGWDNAETALTPANVASAAFNLLHAVPLDEQVDGQPLVLTNQAINGKGIHDVVYVATENNTFYAIDATSGAVLLTRNFGAPVPVGKLPGQCNTNSVTVGINSTPVIDPATGTIYVIAYTLENGTAVYRLHALNPSTLADALPPRTISASHTLSNGSTFAFNANVTRQRAALLAANGNIYAGFASFCDLASNVSRGWVLGWNARSLQPLGSNFLDNSLALSPNNYFLTAVWMSGYGLATDRGGNLMFTTGNSDPNSASYNTFINLSESAVKVSLDLSKVLDFFTPSDFANLERADQDFGSGGLMTLPTQPGSIPYLAIAGGKDGRMFLLDRSAMGRYTPGGPNRVVGTFPMGPCWCGPSYFGGPDGVGRVVSSGGNQIVVWKLQSAPTRTLVQEHASVQLPSGIQDPGSFTTISSNGTQANTAVIWTVRRPTDRTTSNVTLFAFDASTGATLTSHPAGTWPHLTGNANIVPVVANGHVYVASYKQLAIFGLGVAVAPPLTSLGESTPSPMAEHRVSGRIVAINNEAFTLATRVGKPVRVLATEALQRHQSIPLVVGNNVEVQGSFDPDGSLRSTVIIHAKQPGAWSADQ